MEALTRLVTDSLVRHGFDRPIDPRRLQWSRWFPCNSPRSLLVVPSKPGIFAIAEEVAACCGASEPRSRNPERSEGSRDFGNTHVGTAAPGCPAEQSSASASATTHLGESTHREGHDFSRAVTATETSPALATEEIAAARATEPLGGAALQRCDSSSAKEAALAAEARRMLAVLQFSEADNMAFALDRMFTRPSPMRDRLASGRCFLRFVALEDQAQRRSICSALNQWRFSSAEKATGLDFSSSFGADRVGQTLLSQAQASPWRRGTSAPR